MEKQSGSPFFPSRGLFMNDHLVFGLFALYVVGASLYGILSGASDARLACVRKNWGRIRGLSLYFSVYVFLPLLVGIMSVGWGAANFTSPGAELARKDFSGKILKVDWQAIQNLKDAAEKTIELDVSSFILLCA
jgi:hypothetical protein